MPERRALVVAEAVGTAPYYLRGPATDRPPPPDAAHAPRGAPGHDPEHLLPGHGEPLSGDGLGEELERVVARGRRDLPRAWVAAARRFLPGG